MARPRSDSWTLERGLGRAERQPHATLALQLPLVETFVALGAQNPVL